MLQKEVAERICASPGSKTYGILSVLLQAFYSAEYLFTVHETVFVPPPKVKSGVIRLTRIILLILGAMKHYLKGLSSLLQPEKENTQKFSKICFYT